MILPTREALERRRKGYQRRGVVCGVTFALMVASALAPHVGVVEATGAGRSLIPASGFFISAQATAPGFGDGTHVVDVAAGLNLTYFGMAMQQVGLLIGLFTFWSLAAETVGRWTRRFLLIAGWLLALSAPMVITGYRLLVSGQVSMFLGVAWACALGAGLSMVIGGRLAKQRLDSTWYWSKPDWIG
ncbi:MAG TPA: hypothetical protein VIT20_05305 [Propionibacteriaceae bacterium]